MSWIAEYDTQGREFPTCVHVTKTTGTMTHGATYVPIEDGKAVRAENAELRELCRDVLAHEAIDCERCAYGERCRAHETTHYTVGIIIRKRARELGVDE